MLTIFTTTFFAINKFIGTIVGFFFKLDDVNKETWTSRVVLIFWLTIAVSILIFFGWLVSDCGSGSHDKANDARDEAITIGTEANVVANQVKENKPAIEAANKDAKVAEKEREASERRQSNTFDSAEAELRFCRKFPGDDSCRDFCSRLPQECEK